MDGWLTKPESETGAQSRDYPLCMVDRSDTNPLSRYPRTLHLGDLAVVLRLASPDDAALVLELAVRQPADDLLYLRRDLTRPEEVEAWLDRADRGQMAILVAQSGDGLAGYASLDRGDASWRSHVREIRVLVDAAHRGCGLGRALVREALSLAYALGAHKILAQMPREQEGAQRLFEDFGFSREAVLKRHVRDRHGAKHDLVLMTLEPGDE